MSKQKEETIAQVRAARERISEEFGHDPKRLIAHYMELQEKYQTRLLTDHAQDKPQKAA